jgi:hypothetical protein
MELSGGGDEQEEGGRTGRWDCDGMNDPDDTHTSTKILLDWWMEEGNYGKFCGKKNDGIKKIQFCQALADKMTQETTSKRDGKSLLSKIQHIERSWRLAHNFATSETGAGIKENDGEGQFKDIVNKKCPYYFDLLDVMADRASSEPKCTNYDADVNELSLSLSDLSDDEDRCSVATKRTTGTTSSKKSSGSNKKRKALTLMDDSAVAALKAGNKAMEQRMQECSTLVFTHSWLIPDGTRVT